MTTHPMIFSAESVRGLLAGTKTQTRRVMKPVVPIEDATEWSPEEGRVSCPESGWWTAHVNLPSPGFTGRAHCPYGVPGDTIWVKEAWQTYRENTTEESDKLRAAWESFRDGTKDIVSAAESIPRPSGAERVIYAADFGDEAKSLGPWRSPMFMPRWASRIALELTDVRVQKLQEISEEDAIAEGVDASVYGKTYRYAYSKLWDSINGKRKGGIYAWDKNPWIWALTFRKV